MPDSMLQALAGSSPVSAPAEGPAPISTPPVAPTPVEEPGDAADASLGELAIAFKQAEDPQDAAKILVEFMVEAGFKRE